MKKISIAFALILVSCTLMSQTQNENYVESTKESLINNHTFILTNGKGNMLTEFTMSSKMSNGLIKELVSKNGDLTAEQVEFIREVKEDARMEFNDIEYKNSEGEKHYIKYLIVKFKQEDQ